MSDVNDQSSQQAVDAVTRDQGGQFIDEGGAVFTPDFEEAVLNGGGDAQLLDADRQSVNALQVTMERSGADYVHAQKSFITNSGAREIHAESAKLTSSGVLTLKADKAEFKQSSAIIANANEVTMDESRIFMVNANQVHTGRDTQIGFVKAGTVDSSGDVSAFLILGGNVNAQGNVTSTMSAQTAAIAAGVFALVLLVFARLIGRK